MGFLLKNANLLNDEGEFMQQDVHVKDEIIAGISEHIDIPVDEIIDLNGRLLIPGLIDVHAHLREPGAEHKETIETGTQAAARGGFTTVAAMPNTQPIPDDEQTMENLQERFRQKARVRVLPYAPITKGQSGEETVDFDRLAGMGCFAFTDDGVGVQHAGMMLAAMKQASVAGKAVVAHCEDNALTQQGCVHEGSFAARHGLAGIPSVCESVQIARDVLLAEAADAHYHVCHVSTKESVRVIRDAKRAGIHVTAEVTPHHLLLCEEDIPSPDANFKMNPPLRARVDQQALLEGLLDGTIDVIATDHAPHAKEEKALGIAQSPFGIVGLESAFPLLYTNLVKPGILSLQNLVNLLSSKPCEIFGMPFGVLKQGACADLTAIDLENERPINPLDFASKGSNTPFYNWVCSGWPVFTLSSGNLVYREQNQGTPS